MATMAGVPRATLTVAARFQGPVRSANGGYLSGRLASYVLTGGPVAVTLRRPTPLDQPLTVVSGHDGSVRLLERDPREPAAEQERLVAEATPAPDTEIPLVEPVSHDAAVGAMARYEGLAVHPFPGCFVCGTARLPGDGMRLWSGPIPGRPGTVACGWTPDASLTKEKKKETGANVSPATDPGDCDDIPVEFSWAALDCPGAWAIDLAGRPTVLGRITAEVNASPQLGEPCVVMGLLLRRDGRKSYSATTLYGAGDRVLARAVAVWITVDPAAVGRPS